MQVKKHKGKVYGGSMSAAERKAAEIEIKRQLAEFDLKHSIEIDALVLYVLRNEFGFGEKRLKRFYEAFTNEVFGLVDRYKMEDDKAIWLCTYKLNREGIDIGKWHEEFREAIEKRKAELQDDDDEEELT